MSDFGSDAWLDAQLRNVPLPVGLHTRLTQVGGDDALDEQLRDVALPVDLTFKLRRIPGLARVQMIRTFSLAASLLAVAVFGVAYWSQVWSPAQIVRHAKQNEVGPNNGLDAPDALDSAGPREASSDELVDRLGTLPPWEPATSRDAQPSDFAHLAPPAPIDIPSPLKSVAPSRSATESDAFGADGGFDNLPDLRAASSVGPRGIRPPRTPGYDLLYLLKTGRQPFVSPADKALAVSTPPLWMSQSSFDAAYGDLAIGLAPSPGSVRTEDFLAAMDYEWSPAESSGLALRTAAGAAPRLHAGGPTSALLQVAVAASAAPIRSQAAHVFVALDTSASMARSGRFTRSREALLQFARGLRANDLLTVVAFNDRATVLYDGPATTVEQRDHHDAHAALLAALLDTPVGGATNLGAGLDLIATAASGVGEPERSRSLAVISDGLSDLSPVSRARIQALLSRFSTNGVAVHLISLADGEGLSQLVSIAQGCGASHYAAQSESAVQNALRSAVDSPAPVVAHQANLRIAFDPATVESYRLVGHEAITLTGPAGASLQVDFRAGESAVVLYELNLRSGDAGAPADGDRVASVELSWRQPTANLLPSQEPVRQLNTPISKLQFARDFGESAASLQLAALACATAETFRAPASPNASGSFEALRTLADDVSPTLDGNVSFQRLTRMLDWAARLSSAAGRRRSAD